VRHTRDAFEFVGTDIDVVREEGVPVVQWVPADDARELLLRTPEADQEGWAEPGIEDYPSDEVVQFERVGFARIDRQDEDRTVAYFTHS
jgi:glutamyl-tRNA synthetase